MRALATLLAAMCLSAMESVAQEWGARWICHPAPTDTAQVWFRKRVVTANTPRRAFITIASMGHFRLYVNGRNVVTDPFLNPADSLENYIRQYTLDVTRFMEGRKNTIAVWYGPIPGRRSDKQLSLEYYGEDLKGKPFYEQANGSWRCREASAYTANVHGEVINASLHDKAWHYSGAQAEGWTRPHDSADTLSLPLRNTSPLYQGMKIVRILRTVGEQADSTGVTFDFGRPFKGWVRVTLRGAKKGETIYFNGHTYICSGQLDEQAFPRFTVSEQRHVKIWGDDRFKRSQIQSVEGVEIAPYLHTHYQY